jgi:hypothetical protein
VNSTTSALPVRGMDGATGHGAAPGPGGTNACFEGDTLRPFGVAVTDLRREVRGRAWSGVAVCPPARACGAVIRLAFRVGASGGTPASAPRTVIRPAPQEGHRRRNTAGRQRSHGPGASERHQHRPWQPAAQDCTAGTCCLAGRGLGRRGLFPVQPPNQGAMLIGDAPLEQRSSDPGEQPAKPARVADEGLPGVAGPPIRERIE